MRSQSHSLVLKERTQDVHDLISIYKEIFNNREITLSEWETIQSQIPLDLIKKELFHDSCSFKAFVKEMNMQKLEKINHISNETMDEGMEKQSSLEDHNAVFSTNKIKIGSAKLDNEFNHIYKNRLSEIGLNENQIKDVVGIIMSVQNTDEDKEKEQAMKVIRKYCTQNEIPAELSNAMGIQVLRCLKILRTRVARNMGEAIIQKDPAKKKRSLVRMFTSICDVMGESQYEIGCMLVGSGNT